MNMEEHKEDYGKTYWRLWKNIKNTLEEYTDGYGETDRQPWLRQCARAAKTPHAPQKQREGNKKGEPLNNFIQRLPYSVTGRNDRSTPYFSEGTCINSPFSSSIFRA